MVVGQASIGIDELRAQLDTRGATANDHDVLVGLVSIGDVVKARIMEKESEVDSLKTYVAGAG